MKTLKFVSIFLAISLTGGKVIAEDHPKVEMGV